MVGGMDMSAVGAMSASNDTKMVMVMGVVVKAFVAIVAVEGTPA
jgi:hypothetical protein